MQSSEEKDNILSFPVAASEFEGAANWLSRLDRGLSAAEHAKLGEWLSENPAHAAALQELATFWGDLELLSGLDLAAASSGKHKRRLNSGSVGRSLAAMLVMAAVGLGVPAWRGKTSTDDQPAVVQFEQTFSTAIGKRATEQLPDGSSITLNTNTEVHVVYQARDRIVDLRRGEAHFDVAHDVDRPFGVRAAGHIVQAVGTAFNVRIQDAGEVEVTVTEGVVQILDDGRNADTNDSMAVLAWWTNPIVGAGLVRGQIALLRDQLPYEATDAAIGTQEPEILEIKLAWQQGVLIFEGEPLKTVLQEFGRYTTTEFIIENAELGDVRVGGYFEAGNTDALLNTLNENFQIRAERVGNDRILLLSAD